MKPGIAGCEGAILERPAGGRAVAKTSCRSLATGVVVDRAGQGPLLPVAATERSDPAGFDWRWASSPWCASPLEDGLCS